MTTKLTAEELADIKKKITSNDEFDWKTVEDLLDHIAAQDAEIALIKNNAADKWIAQQEQITAKDAEIARLRESLDTAIELFEMDDECNKAGTDAFNWLILAKEVRRAH